MIKILKNTVSDEQTKLRSCEQLEKDSWINLIHPTNEEIKRVASEVGIDSHMISQVLVEKELPRIKKSDNAVLVVIDIPYTKDKSVKNKYVTYPLGIILSDNSYIVTVSLVEHEFLKKIEAEDNIEFFTDRKVRFLIQMLLKSAEVYLSTLNLIDEDIQKVEKSTYYSTNNKQLLNFLNIQKTLVYFITSLQANSSVLEKLHKEDILPISKENKSLLEDAIIENKQCIETSTVYREILSSTIDTYGTIISNNLNVIMKFLAGITIVFSIPTMIASFLGMNVPLGFIGKSELSFFLICIVSLIISILLARWLKKKNML